MSRDGNARFRCSYLDPENIEKQGEKPNRTVKRTTNFVNAFCKGKIRSRSGARAPDRLARLPSR